jgi:hypothetical protein
VRALVGSLVLTGCAAWGGFWALRSAGLLPKDKAGLAGMRSGMTSAGLAWPGREREQGRGRGRGQESAQQQDRGQP